MFLRHAALDSETVGQYFQDGPRIPCQHSATYDRVNHDPYHLDYRVFTFAALSDHLSIPTWCWLGMVKGHNYEFNQGLMKRVSGRELETLVHGGARRP